MLDECCPKCGAPLMQGEFWIECLWIKDAAGIGTCDYGRWLPGKEDEWRQKGERAERWVGGENCRLLASWLREDQWPLDEVAAMLTLVNGVEISPGMVALWEMEAK